MEDPEQSLELAFQCATKAFRMNANASKAQSSLAYTYLYKRQHDQAIHHFQRALALVPGDAGIISIYGMCLVFAGDADAGLEEIARSERLSPMAIGLSEWNVICRVLALYGVSRGSVNRRGGARLVGSVLRTIGRRRSSARRVS